jgi:probable HAF family extracellular repeat protein
VSADGNVIAGWAFDSAALRVRAFRWTATTGMVGLGVLNNGLDSSAAAMNQDGSVIVGTSSDGSIVNAPPRAFRWTAATGMVTLDPGNTSFHSAALGVSGDGNIVVGEMSNGLSAFRWTQATGMVSLGQLNGGLYSSARAISRDGHVIVGVALDGAIQHFERAFRWTADSGLVSLGTLGGGGFRSFATAVNRDGSVIVGYGDDPASGFTLRAFRWTQSGGLMTLGAEPGGPGSFATAVNADGSVVVGGTSLAGAFRWTAQTGMQTIAEWLRSHGIDALGKTRVATGVSDDGNVIVGVDSDNAAFVARASSAGSGLVTLQDLQASLAANTAAGVQVSRLGSMVLNGAHSRPLAHRVKPGESCIWTAGDVGRDDHGENDGSFGLVEVGACRRLSETLQASLSIGRTWSRQHLVFSGKSEATTTYGIAEVLGRIPGTTLWPSASILYQAGDVEARRGYLNAGAQDSSSGRPDVRTLGARIRLDWEDAFHVYRVGFSPYVDFSYLRTHIDSYVESGGGFPASFDSRTDKATELRVGIDPGYEVTPAVKLVARLEAAHRFEKSAAATSGAVIGLFGFRFAGAQSKRDWLRAGVGFEAKLGSGVLSASVNATTEGAVPSRWLNVAYRLAF